MTLVNAVYRAIAFTGSAPESDRERTLHWITGQNLPYLTQGLRLEELGEELERSFLSTNSPPLGLSSWSRNLLARDRAGHGRVATLKVLGMDLRQCGPQEWCWLASIVSWLVLVERQLDLSSVAARLRGLTNENRYRMGQMQIRQRSVHEIEEIHMRISKTHELQSLEYSNSSGDDKDLLRLTKRVKKLLSKKNAMDKK
ncbi:hypothetical protein Taro_010871 [Colocasia esculenta]|uniref:Uncharacterized protein n=1 Tax=Colocasia esculenta TaxID=4460 RepID=A0A843U023_COLES|nr:hypothetical protein [Colocasia esculenta]